MAAYTIYKNLEKPSVDELYNIGVANKNNDVIDSEFHKLDIKNQEQDELINILATTEQLNEHIADKNNPHEVSREQNNLGNVENKSSSMIRDEITKQNIVTALGYTPYTPNEVEAMLAPYSDSERNVIISISKNGKILNITEDRNIDIEIPEKLSDLDDDLNHITINEAEINEIIEQHTGGVKLGKDSDGNPGYYKYDEETGTDTFCPFNSQNVTSSCSKLHIAKSVQKIDITVQEG